MTKRTLFCLMLAALLLCSLIPTAVLPAAAEETIEMQPCYTDPFQPEGTTYGQISFRVPAGTQGLTKDGWDNALEHNTDLILVSFVKDGVAYDNMTVPAVKEMLGDLPLKRTCYTYESGPDGSLYLNLRFHMDDHSVLKPADFTAITIKAGFVWCVGSPSGISGELSALTLDHDVYFPVNAEAGITAVQTGPMPGIDGALRINFERKDSASLKAISATDLCPSAIPGKTLGDLVTINGETVTDLVKKGNVARFNFYGNTMIFHIDDPAYLAALKEEQYEIVILPGFRWFTWDKDDWGNWAGSNKDKYTPVDGTLVLEPISFTVNTADEVCVKTNGISIVDGYKDTYYVGERIDMTTLVISINYASGDSMEMMIIEDMVTYDFSKAGTATVTVNYDGMTASFEVTVLPVPETEPETQTQPETEADSEQTTESTTAAPEQTTEAESVTDPASESVDDLVSEPAIDNEGCGAVLVPASVLMLAFAAIALRKKED
ncbi:MAG: bacterial Ig-like domain-containing protein [Clostridia bacterium]|nr:bacterial Ig-like domain-containing protein [Clostridia bacterium]MBQ7380355.1 bacterial Ig-like domain-containing protein [Clostridia bacterium]